MCTYVFEHIIAMFVSWLNSLIRLRTSSDLKIRPVHCRLHTYLLCLLCLWWSVLHVFGVSAVPVVPRVAGVTCVLAVPSVLVGPGGSAVYVVPVVPCVLGAPCTREHPTTHPMRNPM